MSSISGASCWAPRNFAIQEIPNALAAAGSAFGRAPKAGLSSTSSEFERDLGQPTADEPSGLVEIENLIFCYPSKRSNPEDIPWYLKVDRLTIPERCVCL